MGEQERLNVFRRFFASGRYWRLHVQQLLIRTAIDGSLMQKVNEMENLHNQQFADILKTVNRYGFIGEFVIAVNEEDAALQKIIEAYDKRMEGKM